MSMYTLLQGENPHALLLLSLLGLERKDVPRYRDAWLDAEGRIAIYTRMGGGNRSWHDTGDEPGERGPECACAGCIADFRLPAIDGFDHDEDDDFDSTYRTFYFAVPPQYAEVVASMQRGASGDERWARTLADLETLTPEQAAAKYPWAVKLLEEITRVADAGS